MFLSPGPQIIIQTQDNHAKSALFALLVLVSGPAFYTSVSGQVNSIVLALCLGGVLLGLRRQHLLGGVMLAFACWIKIYPVPLIDGNAEQQVPA